MEAVAPIGLMTDSLESLPGQCVAFGFGNSDQCAVHLLAIKNGCLSLEARRKLIIKSFAIKREIFKLNSLLYTRNTKRTSITRPLTAPRGQLAP